MLDRTADEYYDGSMDMGMSIKLEQNKKLVVKVITGAIILMVAFAFYLAKDIGNENKFELSSIPETASEESYQTSAPAVEASVMIMIDVAGAVQNPSVVELPEGSRVFEAIQRAGGLTKEADTDYINQAELLTDGEKIYIPTKQEVQESQKDNDFPGSIGLAGNGYSHEAGQSRLININTADSGTLQQLSGIGPATAEKIINYRNENGKFNSIEEIKNVSGIGDKTFEKLKNKITI